jgi:thiamine biosynthesis protein ThiI
MKLVSLLSGGIDSPVASYVMSKMGADVILLHMDNGKFCDGKDTQKAIDLAVQLEKVTGREFPVYQAEHGDSQAAIAAGCEHGYQCVMCKRTMQHVAKEFAIRNGCGGIVMGDSLGQVASQTLRNIRAECQGLDFPIVRPLIGMDKVEIIDIARRIGTYDISIRQSVGCTAVPDRPVTEAKIEKVAEMQSRIDFSGMVKSAADSAVRIH